MSHLDAAFQPGADPEQVADVYMAVIERTEAACDDGQHCYHHQHDDGCDEFGDCDDDANDDCVGCDCCCTNPSVLYARAQR